MQPSRRAFLMGRRPVQTPWAAFLQKLKLLCQGQIDDLGEGGEGAPRAVLTPTRDADVAHARTLCAEYRIVMSLLGAAGPFAPAVRPQLLIDPSHLAGLVRLTDLPDGRPRWRAQPGVPVASLVAAGLRQFAGLPGEMSLAQWLSAPAPWPAGRCAASSLLSVDVMLADGVEETLGPFGEADVQPLRSATVQSLIPALFRLSSGGDAFATNDGYHWLGRYRLDALKPQAPDTVNLAHLLLGQGGTLAWVQSMVLTDAAPWNEAAMSTQTPAQTPGLATHRLDAKVKALFDPDGRFPLFLSPDT